MQAACCLTSMCGLLAWSHDPVIRHTATEVADFSVLLHRSSFALVIDLRVLIASSIPAAYPPLSL
ncbi:hypothetical protein [Ornithinimicrobium sp. INDO-MA30-4]|uniref:hypothetical protein n=1 Tax=Ornithinimicrobium sp. INDO-MA30-4 TaxID=2908651 RepID=UPI001F25434E|nr:hypothetical protein [Ornithinimicrobium sp. INDO-MA30-4]UJH70276.1 hypothetical protein L0A91_14155 [Ornithinimicrobium sp. INDO-MA30-4]